MYSGAADGSEILPTSWCPGGGFKDFHPYLGIWSNLNHQLDMVNIPLFTESFILSLYNAGYFLGKVGVGQVGPLESDCCCQTPHFKTTEGYNSMNKLQDEFWYFFLVSFGIPEPWNILPLIAYILGCPASEAKPGNVETFDSKPGAGREHQSAWGVLGSMLFVWGDYQENVSSLCNLCNLFPSNSLKVPLLSEEYRFQRVMIASKL